MVFRLDFSLFMAIVAQLVRALDCGSKGRGFEPRRSPIVLYSQFEIVFRLRGADVVAGRSVLRDFARCN